jgi:hypothetical protein
MNPFNHIIWRRKHLLLVVWVLFTTLIFVRCQATFSPPAPTVDFQFPVAPQFTDFYHTYGGAIIFGEPLTESLIDPDSGRLIQYFTRMRLELDGDPEDNQLLLARIAAYPLGEWAHAGLTNITLLPSPEGGPERYFPETGFSVRDAFLDFYQQNHGELLFGPPISEILEEGGKRVQYFRNARLEWQPGLPLAYRVQPGLLGRAHFDTTPLAILPFAGPIERAQPRPATGVDAVMVDVSVRSPVVYQGETQQLFARVETVDRRPVEGARIVVRVTYGDVSEEVGGGLVDSLGIWRQAIDLSAVPPGERVQLQLLVYNSEDRLLGQKAVACRTWW